MKDEKETKLDGPPIEIGPPDELMTEAESRDRFVLTEIILQGIHPDNIEKIFIKTNWVEPPNIKEPCRGTFPSTLMTFSILLKPEGRKQFEENRIKPAYWRTDA